MKLKEIKLNALINIGPYSHVTMDVSGELDSKDNIAGILANFKSEVEGVMKGLVAGEVVTVSAATEEIKEEKVTKKKAKKVADAPATSPIIEEVVEVESIVSQSKEETKTKKTKVVSYDSTVPEHKSIFGGYLAKKYDTTWKVIASPQEIKGFTASLNGKPFLNEDGSIVDSFLGEVHSFFGE